MLGFGHTFQEGTEMTKKELRSALKRVRGEASLLYDAAETRELLKQDPFLRGLRRRIQRNSNTSCYFFASPKKPLEPTFLHRTLLPESTCHPSGLVVVRSWSIYALDRNGREIARFQPKHRAALVNALRVVDWLAFGIYKDALKRIRALAVEQTSVAIPIESSGESMVVCELGGAAVNGYLTPQGTLEPLIRLVLDDENGEHTQMLTRHDLCQGVAQHDERMSKASQALDNLAQAFLSTVWPKFEPLTRHKRLYRTTVELESKAQRFSMEAEKPRRVRAASFIVTLRSQASGNYVSFRILDPSSGHDRVEVDDVHASLAEVETLIDVFASGLQDHERAQGLA